ncbi:tetratricopeptide repeat protein [Methanolacinia paynteri]|uniref:tetratricopeptide repeat protein n=1 Tax=Methanolacinia paynteri TaxID=230356 RepID=UPI00064E3B28|nr:tetratricopeptide repeat protein [Methanolacinia paynteri]
MSEKNPEGSLKTESDQNLIDELFEEEKDQYLAKNYSEAKKTLEKILELDKGNIQALDDICYLCYKLKNYEEELVYFNLYLEHISKDNPKFNDVLRKKGITLSVLNREAEAIECFDEVIGLDRDNMDAYYSKGISLAKLGKYKEAIECFDDVIGLDRDNMDAYYSKGISLAKLGKFKEAIKCFDEIIRLDSDNKEAYYKKGIYLSKNNDDDAAIKCFDKVLSFDPCNQEANKKAYISKGISLRKLKRYEESIECFDEVIRIDPYNVWAYINKGNSAKQLKYYGLSLQALNRALEAIEKVNQNEKEKEKQKYQIYIEKGNVLIELLKYADAIYDIKRALEIMNDDPKGLVRMGVSFSRLGDDAEAIKCFDKALQVTEKNIKESSGKKEDGVRYYLDSLVSKGVSFSRQGRDNAALKCFNVVIDCFQENSDKEQQNEKDKEECSDEKYIIEINNYFIGNPEIKKTLQGKKLNALNNKGRALFNQKKYTEALKCFEKAADQEKNYWKAFYSKGILLMEWENCPDENRYQNALESFNIAISIDPSNPELHAQKGNALMMLDRFEEADNSFNTALRIDKSCASAYTGLGSSKARKELMIEELKCQKKLLEGITNAVEGTQNNLSKLSKKMESSLDHVSTLFYVQFALGVFLLFLAVFLPFFGLGDIFIGALSAVGGTALVATSITTAPGKIQKNRIDYSQWLIAYYNWIHTHHGLSSYLLGEIKKSQKQADLINTGTPDDWQKIEKMYKYLNEVSITTIQQMELFCEFPLKDKNNDAYIELLKGVRPQEEDEAASDNTEDPKKSPDPSSSAGKK